MKIEKFLAPSYEELRPFRSRPAEPGAFPVYEDLADLLAAAHQPGSTAPQKAHPIVAHVLGTCAGYAYSEGSTVAMIMARLGLDANACVTVSETVDAMFICSTAHLVQSKCGRALVLSYRGTEPVNLVNWLTDADVHPEKVSLGANARAFQVHAGFYRNVRATRYEVANQMKLALEGRSLHDGRELKNRLEVVYVCGHSLGGALAALFGLMMFTNPAYRPIADRIGAVYTYGQPMIGEPPLPPECGPTGAMGIRTFRYIYAQDVVPALPPTASGPFEHFGEEWRFSKPDHGKPGRFERSQSPMAQVGNLLEIPLAVSAFFGDQMKWFKHVSFRYSLADHGPQHYVSALAPPGKPTEFGD